VIKAAQILGLVGGVGGAILSSLVILIVRVRRFLDRASSTEFFPVGIPFWSYLVFILAVVGIVGAAMVKSRPRSGAILLLVSGGGGIVLIIARVLIAGRASGNNLLEGFFSVLLLASGILGLILSRRQRAPESHQ
jgi:hypothetical protein